MKNAVFLKKNHHDYIDLQFFFLQQFKKQEVN